jgi:hypothetical protein
MTAQPIRTTTFADRPGQRPTAHVGADVNHNETLMPAPKQAGLPRGLAMANHNETLMPALKESALFPTPAMNHNETLVSLAG